MSWTLMTLSPLKSAITVLQGGPGCPLQPLNQAEMKSKMSWMFTPLTWLTFAGQQVVKLMGLVGGVVHDEP